MPEGALSLAPASRRYRVEGTLGQGGMAVVQRVLDTESGRHVALKRLRVDGGGTKRENIVRLFEREYLTLAQLAHPRVVEVYDYGHDDEGPYYTMELLDGGDLHALSPVPWQRACVLARDVCSALALLHSRRMVYRDLSPRNVRCTSDGAAKLIDFGAMAPMGQSRELVGTAPFVAPEVLNLQPLDARTDLYALGATLYFTLVQRHAFPARDISQLRDLWRSRPRRPSEIVADIPPALDCLVMDLMHLDPAVRPASASEVMARLAAIAGLRASEHLLVTRAYLANPTLVGRAQQLAAVRKLSLRAVQRRGASLLVRGASGIGRSRFLDACVLEAKLAGLLVLRANPGESVSNRFGIVETLASQLLTSARELAVDAAQPNLSVLGHAMPELMEGRTDIALAPCTDPLDLQRQVHAAVQAWLRRVARKRSLMIAVDDFGQLDEHSAALLALLAQAVKSEGLWLATTTCTTDRESGAVRSAREFLESASVALELEPLTLEQTEELLDSVFGDVPNVAVVASYLHRVGGGRPRDMMQLAQQLVDDDVVRYLGGTWSLPARLSEAVLPSSMSEALAGRVATLSHEARKLALALACEPDQRFSFEECAFLMRGAAARAVAQALDELMAAEVVQLAGSRYSMRQLAWVAALRNRAAPGEVVAAHAALAQLFEGREDQIRGAQHLLRSEQHARGLDMLLAHAVASKRQTDIDARAFFKLLHGLPLDWLDTYEHALRLVAELGRPARQRTLLLCRADGLVVHAISDTFAYWVIQENLDQLYIDCGLDLYKEMPDTLDALTRVRRTLGAAQARYDALPERERSFAPADAVRALTQTTMTALGAIGYAQDYEAVRRLPDLGPLAPLSPTVALVAMLSHGIAARLRGCNEEAIESYHAVLARSAEPDRAGLTDTHHASMQLRVLLSIATMEAAMGRPESLEFVAKVEHEREFAPQAMMVRHIYYVWQGNTQEASRCKRKAEVLQIESVVHHGYEGLHLFNELCAYALADDLTRVKRATDAIEPRASTLRAWRPALHFGRGEYNRIRGDQELALSELNQALSLLELGFHPIWTSIAGAQLRVLTELERYEEVLSLATHYLAVDPALGYQQDYLRMPFALALAMLERVDEATEVAESVIGRFQALGITGLNLAAAYEVRARVALAAGAQADFESYAALCAEQWPAAEKRLMGAKYQRPTEVREPGDEYLDELSIMSQFTSTLLTCHGTEDRALCGLEYLARQSGASAGVLYVLTKRGLTRSAQFGALEPDDDQDVWASQYFARQSEIEEGTEEHSSPPPASSITESQGTIVRGMVAVLLNHPSQRGFALTGLALLYPAPDAAFVYPNRLAVELSRTLADVNGVVTLYT